MTHTTKMMTPAIGQVVNVRAESWTIPMTVVDAKSAWGQVRLLVRPLRGTGEAWVELSRCSRIGDNGLQCIEGRE